MLKCVLAVLSFTYVCDAPYFSWLWMLAVWACEWLFLQWHIGDINVCWCGRDPLQRANMCVACAAERMNKNILHRTRTHTHTRIRANRWIWMLRRMKKNIIIMVHRYYVHQYNQTHTQSTFSYTLAFRIDVKEVDRTQAKDSTINNNNKNGCCCCCTKYTNFNEFLCGIHWYNGDFLFVIMNISTNFIF